MKMVWVDYVEVVCSWWQQVGVDRLELVELQGVVEERQTIRPSSTCCPDALRAASSL